MGFTSAAEIFQGLIGQVLDGISGVANIQDDILIAGSSEHDSRLEAVLRKLSDAGLM